MGGFDSRPASPQQNSRAAQRSHHSQVSPLGKKTARSPLHPGVSKPPSSCENHGLRGSGPHLIQAASHSVLVNAAGLGLKEPIRPSMSSYRGTFQHQTLRRSGTQDSCPGLIPDLIPTGMWREAILSFTGKNYWYLRWGGATGPPHQQRPETSRVQPLSRSLVPEPRTQNPCSVCGSESNCLWS